MLKVTLELQAKLLRRRFAGVRRLMAGNSREQAKSTFSFQATPDQKSALTQGKPNLVKEAAGPRPPQAAPRAPKSISNDVLLNIKVQKSTVKTERKWARGIQKALTFFFVTTSLILLLLLFAPVAYYQFFSSDPVPIKSEEVGSPLGGEFVDGAKESQRQIAEPPYDESLPEGNWLIIPRVGIYTQILESENPEESLRQGIWRVPDFGTPGDVSKPMILAGHRYGYQWWWKGDYWRYHSFYLLPDLQPGDFIEVISNKRKYMYEIYSGEEGGEITDYDADLILYTCKFLNSPVRHFRYARLLDPTKSTQTVSTK
jgi:hypothetical protein